MAEGVVLNVILTDDGQPAGRPTPSSFTTYGSPVPPTGGTSAFNAANAASSIASMAKMGGSAEAAAAAGGPLAMAAAAGSAALTKTFDTLRQTIESTGRVFADAAGNDYMKAFSRTVYAASESLAQIPIVGENFAARLKLAAAPVTAFAEVVSAFVERGKQLADYSPQLAISNAMAEMKSTFADMREAQELQGGISRMTDAQSELLIMFRDTMLPIKKWLVETLASIMETLIQLAREGYIQLVGVWETLKRIPEYIQAAMTTWNFTPITQSIRDELQKVRDEIAKNRPVTPDAVNDAVERMMQDMVDAAGGPLGRFDPVLPNGGRFP